MLVVNWGTCYVWVYCVYCNVVKSDSRVCCYIFGFLLRTYFLSVCSLSILFFINGKHMQTVSALLSFELSIGCV